MILFEALYLVSTLMNGKSTSKATEKLLDLKRFDIV